MAKLTKEQARRHHQALALLEKDILTDDEKEFFYNNYHEAATNINTSAGAFFTPLDLAYDFALDAGGSDGNYSGSFVDLCAGIGVLSFATRIRFPNAKITCIEINPEYVEIGKKLLPDADWYCMDVMDLEAISQLGHFHVALSNPPFGPVKTFSGKRGPKYTGAHAEYKVIDIASMIACTGCFLIPQQSAGFVYSGKRGDLRDKQHDKYKQFSEQTGICLEMGMGIDTEFIGYKEGWKDVKPLVEIACIDFAEVATNSETDINQLDMFSQVA